MRLTNNSLATVIAWVSTCLLACGVSTLFSDSTRIIWMTWGGFGLASAVGLDVSARVREKVRLEELRRISTKRIDREFQLSAAESEANMAIREAVGRILGGVLPEIQRTDTRRTHERFPCSLDAEIILQQHIKQLSSNPVTSTEMAKITNLSESGFEITLENQVTPQRAAMIITMADQKRITMLADILWCTPLDGGAFIAGGRFMQVLPVEEYIGKQLCNPQYT